MKIDKDINEVKNVFITKYALTKGIYKTKAIIYKDSVTNMIKDVFKQTAFYHGEEWHLTEDKAIQMAEEMRIKKLRSLEKQIKKISSIKFEIKRLKEE